MPDATRYVQKKETTILCKVKEEAIGLGIAEMADAPNRHHPLIRAEGGSPPPILLLRPAEGHVDPHVP